MNLLEVKLCFLGTSDKQMLDWQEF